MEILAVLSLIGMYHLYYKKKNGKSFFPPVESSELFWSKTLGYTMGVFSIWVIQSAIRSEALCRKQSITLSDPSANFFLMLTTLSVLPLYLIYRTYHLSVADLGPKPGEVKGATVRVQILVLFSVWIVAYRLYDSFCAYSITDMINMIRALTPRTQ